MRRQSREIALQVLFQTEFAPQIRVADMAALHGENFDNETIAYAEEIVTGVLQHQTEIDQKIQSASRHWKMERMASVDRNILKIGVYEMSFSAHPLKSNIVIDEAVEIAKKYGTTDSGSFVNGVLDQISREN